MTHVLSGLVLVSLLGYGVDQTIRSSTLQWPTVQIELPISKLCRKQGRVRRILNILLLHRRSSVRIKPVVTLLLYRFSRLILTDGHLTSRFVPISQYVIVLGVVLRIAMADTNHRCWLKT